MKWSCLVHTLHRPEASCHTLAPPCPTRSFTTRPARHRPGPDLRPAAKMLMVSPRIAKKWPERYRLEKQGRDGQPQLRATRLSDQDPTEVVRRIVRPRWRHPLGLVQIASRLAIAASTVHAVLIRCRMNRLSHVDRVAGEPLRRYKHPHPGSLIHIWNRGSDCRSGASPVGRSCTGSSKVPAKIPAEIPDWS